MSSFSHDHHCPVPQPDAGDGPGRETGWVSNWPMPGSQLQGSPEDTPARGQSRQTKAGHLPKAPRVSLGPS